MALVLAHGLLRSQRAFVRGLGVFDPKSESKRKTLLDDGVPCATSAIVATVSRFTVTRVRGCILRSDSDPIRGSVGVLGLLSGLLCCDDITEAIGLMMKCLRSKERERPEQSFQPTSTLSRPSRDGSFPFVAIDGNTGVPVWPNDGYQRGSDPTVLFLGTQK